MPSLTSPAIACVGAILLATASSADVAIHTDYPGANIIVERQEDHAVYLRQDLRDTEGWWFYWNFGATAAASETVTFHFTHRNVIGTRGPAASLDGGESWSWLGMDSVEAVDGGVAFTYTFDADATAVRFAFAPPYQAADLDTFLARHEGHPHLAVETLCETEQGRPVERLRLGRLDGAPAHRILLTARHHSCESVASYVLEGLMGALLADTDTGAWFREHVEVLAIPLVDKDGVEDGDQGKNRKPRDHGRDYAGEALYNSTRAIRAYVPAWSEGLLRFTLDFHCPYIRGAYNEHIYQVGHADPAIWREQQRFARLLEAVPDRPLSYTAAGDLPYGEAWNTGGNYTEGAPVSRWTVGLDGVRYASTLEVPYANAGDTTVTPENARAFGAAMLTAIRAWLETLEE